jgi:endogenous inhibitor of DNA gyrase (YacG/DUF329 family)
MARKSTLVPKVKCPGCKVEMELKRDKATIIRIETRTKTVTYKCPRCGTETERRMAV